MRPFIALLALLAPFTMPVALAAEPTAAAAYQADIERIHQVDTRAEKAMARTDKDRAALLKAAKGHASDQAIERALERANRDTRALAAVYEDKVREGSDAFRAGYARYDVPYINQHDPAGVQLNYPTPHANCGPTSVAMIARAFGLGGGASDAELIERYRAIAGTAAAGHKGTSLAGLKDVAKAEGMACTSRAGLGAPGWLDGELAAGKLLVVNGDFFSMPPHANAAKAGTAGHFVVVSGRTPDGLYLVRDPADPLATTLTADDLAGFVAHAHKQADGSFKEGAVLAFGPPQR